jgi:tRNA pseudouridine38-40 synthase
MPRYRITIEYDGTPFVGWQFQINGRSIQGELERALKQFSGETAGVRGSGRTDAGVHALGQVAHFDLVRDWEPFKIREAFNYHLKPLPIAVLDCDYAPEGFDARFSAVARHYLFRILNRRALPALDQNRVWWQPVPLDAAAMHEAAQHLIGRHDFSTFRAAGCQAKSPIKTLNKLDVSRVGEEIHITTSARSFMHNQVRSMVGSLKLVGAGRWAPDDMRRALEAKDRSACGPVAPPEGLYFVRVDYGPTARPPAVEDDADDDGA